MKKTTLLNLLSFIGLLLSACQSDFLDEKPQKSLLVPMTLSDFQALLDNGQALMNTAPYHSILADGDFQMTESYYQGQSQVNQTSYLWVGLPEISLPGWDTPYKQVFTCNVVLDGLAKIDRGQVDSVQYNAIKGSALFFRAFAFYQLAQLFSPAYQTDGKGDELGIPLPLQADINLKPRRSSVQQTYQRIIRDLTDASALLLEKPDFISRPSRPAALALLSRAALSMQDYPAALSYAENCLAIKSTLLDYNLLSSAAAVPFPLPFTQGNAEMIFYSRLPVSYFENAAITVDSSLYSSYKRGDLRQVLYFGKGLNYKGNYTATQYPFAGLSTDEVYLNKAECLARLGQTETAIQVLNVLLEKRFTKADFISAVPGPKEQALGLILLERRKELIGRGTRWSDLKRLNTDPAYATVLTRTMMKKVYKLEPGSERYQFKIPEDQVSEGTVTQNP